MYKVIYYKEKDWKIEAEEKEFQDRKDYEDYIKEHSLEYWKIWIFKRLVFLAWGIFWIIAIRNVLKQKKWNIFWKIAKRLWLIAWILYLRNMSSKKEYEGKKWMLENYKNDFMNLFNRGRQSKFKNIKNDIKNLEKDLKDEFYFLKDKIKK